MESPNTARVLASVFSMGVPVKPMNEAFGRASRMCRAKPSMKSYWLLCASSAMTTMLRRSEGAAAGEGAEQLVVEVVAVREQDDGWVGHRRVQDHAARVERHGQALARALRMPHHTHAAVAGVAAALPCLVPSGRLCDPGRRGGLRGAQRLFPRGRHPAQLGVT